MLQLYSAWYFPYSRLDLPYFGKMKPNKSLKTVYIIHPLSTQCIRLNPTQASQATTKVIISKIESPCLDKRHSGNTKGIICHIILSGESRVPIMCCFLKQMLVHSFHLPRPTKTYSNLACFAASIIQSVGHPTKTNLIWASLEFTGYLHNLGVNVHLKVLKQVVYEMKLDKLAMQ